VKLALTEGETLLSGLAANVDIVVDRTSGLLVPSQALIERSIEDLPPEMASSPLIDLKRKKATVVYRMIDGKASVTLVKTGSSNLADTMITEGINAGDIVVTGPYRVLERLKEGDAIREETAKDALEREGDTKVGVSVG
jgi:HlyD family secretion protein